MMISDIAFVAEPLNYFRTHAETVRSKAAAGAGNLAEDYRGLGERLSSVDVPAPLVDRACDEMATYWLDSMKKARRLDLRNRLRIYRVASEVDPKLKRRLIRKLPAYLFR